MTIVDCNELINDGEDGWSPLVCDASIRIILVWVDEYKLENKEHDQTRLYVKFLVH